MQDAALLWEHSGGARRAASSNFITSSRSRMAVRPTRRIYSCGAGRITHSKPRRGSECERGTTTSELRRLGPDLAAPPHTAPTVRKSRVHGVPARHVTHDDAGSAYVRCVRHGVPPKELLRTRTLTAEEVNRLVRLVREGNLFAGAHIGIDGTGSDGPPFATLRVTVEAETGVLVTSGNPSFTTGARQQLLDWLHAVMRELEESPG